MISGTIGFFLGVASLMCLRWVLFRLNKEAVQHGIEDLQNKLNDLRNGE